MKCFDVNGFELVCGEVFLFFETAITETHEFAHSGWKWSFHYPETIIVNES